MSGASSSTERAEETSPIRVLVADDEETVVDVLRALIGSDPSLRFVGAAHNAEDAIELTVRERPDVVLLDVRMPGRRRAARDARDHEAMRADEGGGALGARGLGHGDRDDQRGGERLRPERRFDGQDPADDPSNDRRELHRRRAAAATHPGLSDAPSAHAAEHRGREGDPGRGDHRRVRTDRGSRHGTDRRRRRPATRGDPSPPFLRHLARRCRGRRPPPRHGDGRVPGEPRGAAR